MSYQTFSKLYLKFQNSVLYDKNACFAIFAILYFRYTGQTQGHPLPSWFARWTSWSDRVKFGTSGLVMCRAGSCRKIVDAADKLGCHPWVTLQVDALNYCLLPPARVVAGR